MEDNTKSPPVPLVLPPISTYVPLFSSRGSSSHATSRQSPPPSSRISPFQSRTSPLLPESPIKRENEEEAVTHRSGETPLRGHHDFDKRISENATRSLPSDRESSMRSLSPLRGDNPMAMAMTMTMGGDDASFASSAQKCKLVKCCVCERGVPDSFSHAKPISWYAVCRLTMWALSQDGVAQSRKWFSLGRDICPFVEAHKWICGREFTTNWRTTIGITMSSSVKKGLFAAGNPNELGLGYYSLVDDSTDPETVPQPVGRVYKSPSSVGQSSMSSFQIIPVQIPTPTTPPEVVEAVMNLSTPSYESQGPLKKRKILPGESVHRVQRQNKERKHTTDAERQLLMDYYEKHNTCTTCPEFTELMNKLSWDYHRTKIWLYNRKTYKQTRPIDKKHKRLKANPDTPTNQGMHDSLNNSESSSDTRIVEDDSGDEFYDGDESPQPETIPSTPQASRSNESIGRTSTSASATTSSSSNNTSDAIEIHDSTGIPIIHHHTNITNTTSIYPPTTTSSSTKPDTSHEYVECLEKHTNSLQTVDSLRKQLAAEKQARTAAVSQCMIKDDHIIMLEQTLAKLQKFTSDDAEIANADSELMLLRQQVEMYCRELREEKQRRSEQEMRAFDHLAQINVLTLRNLQLEKVLKSHPSNPGSAEPASINININNNIGGDVKTETQSQLHALPTENVGGSKQ